MTDFDSVLDELNYFLYALMQDKNGQIPYKTKWRSPAILDLETYETLLKESVCYEFVKENYRIKELKDVCAFQVGRRKKLIKGSSVVFTTLNILAVKCNKGGKESFERVKERYENELKERYENE